MSSRKAALQAVSRRKKEVEEQVKEAEENADDATETSSSTDIESGPESSDSQDSSGESSAWKQKLGISDDLRPAALVRKVMSPFKACSCARYMIYLTSACPAA